jgi:D-beta-D-heptose 7-phosphate kinase / D-beta-D-heptose 1-phosphate adenosyltransferase
MRFLVIGDSMTDVYWRGHISRLNPEKHAAPLIAVREEIHASGGAGNVAQNLRALGAEVTLISGMGKIYKHRIVDDDGVICRFDVGDELSPITEPDLPDEKFDAIIISDYAKGSVTPNLAMTIKAKYRGPIFVDTKVHPAPWIGANCLFPNASEFARHAYDYKCAKLLLVKQGKDGAQLVRNGTRSERLESRARHVSNVSGAGDTVIAAYATMYCKLVNRYIPSEMELASARFAMDMAAVSVAYPLTHAPTINQVCAMFPDREEYYRNLFSEKP